GEDGDAGGGQGREGHSRPRVEPEGPDDGEGGGEQHHQDGARSAVRRDDDDGDEGCAGEAAADEVAFGLLFVEGGDGGRAGEGEGDAVREERRRGFVHEGDDGRPVRDGAFRREDAEAAGAAVGREVGGRGRACTERFTEEFTHAEGV